MPPEPVRQLLLDVSVLVHQDDKSGVQRVVRNVLRVLLESPPPGLTVAPVYDAGGFYAYARELAPPAEPEPVAVAPGDIFLGLDLAPNHIPANLALLRSLRAHGVALYFVVYDLLPIRQPDMFIGGAGPWFAAGVASVAAVADGLLCISRAVADDLLDWLDEHPVPHPGKLQVGWFHLGADLDRPSADAPLAPAERAVLECLGTRPALLMVGTLEPRKQHALALDAVETLWRDGAELDLVLVGRAGWMVEDLTRRLNTHAELGKRLFWLDGAGDSALRQLYARSAALLAVSSGEGFGLPLIEAAQHGLPVIARDLPVFREVAGSHAYYIDGASAASLAQGVRGWLALHARGTAPASAGMPWMSWEQSTALLLDRITRGQWYRQASSRLG